MPDELAVIWLFSPEPSSSDTLLIAQWDEAFHCAHLIAAGIAEKARLHSGVTKRIGVSHWLNFTN